MKARNIVEKLVRFGWRVVRLGALPLFQGPEEVLVGGQAVIEGVMMRSPHSYAVAVRRPNGSIAVGQDYLARPSEKHPWLRYPILRGLATLGQAMALGIRALRYSAEHALEDPKAPEAATEAKKKPEMGGWMLALNIVLSLGFFIVVYKLLPLYMATRLQSRYSVVGNLVVFNFVDGMIRLVLFLAFLTLLAQSKEIQRVFQYHGAEHKVVWAFEKTGRMDLETARASTRFHPRCGTSFLLVVMVIAMFFYMVLPFHTFTGKLVGRLVLLPVIAGVSYEFIRFAAKSKGTLWRWASQPGLWLQRITTREPDDSQLETAIKALESAMELEKMHGGELVIA
ncbi:MAG TPA: DUF1385 domain-containing protein [Terriglobia bacterium]|nr:DUF1385 domain-containing protein [Terriglobia bacterium]